MDIFLDNTNSNAINGALIITGSKSESNRLLVLKQLYDNLSLENLSNSDDTCVLRKALSTQSENINIGHAGTAMRFLTAYFSSVEGKEVTLSGSGRMHQRPIKVLVDALTSIGSKITYLERKGYPPIKIKGTSLTKENLSIQGNVSSQYISALLLIAPSLKNGLSIELLGKVTSVPYIKMTLSLLNQLGIKANWEDSFIKVFPITKIAKKTIIVESDWSSASYFYSLIALSEKGEITLSSYNENSLQGDKVLVAIYESFGVQTTFLANSMLLKKVTGFKQKKQLQFNLINSPDIAQTIAVTCLGLGVSCELTGLHTLKIKETDRLEALKNELQKFGAKVKITSESLHLKTAKSKNQKSKVINIKTYEDHRMAMAFAPLSLKHPITIKNAEVVTKSFPGFWQDLNAIVKPKL